MSSAHRCCRARVVKYCVAAELLEDFDRDSRRDGLIYIAANQIHFILDRHSRVLEAK